MNDKGKKPGRGRCDEEGRAGAVRGRADNHDRLRIHVFSRHGAQRHQLEWEQMSALEGEVIDRFYIVTPTHGSSRRRGCCK